MVKGELISPFVVDLPKTIFEQAQLFVQKVYEIKESSEYQKDLSQQLNLDDQPQTPSVLSCFDFHYNEEQGLKLIEINTNASLFLPFCLPSQAHGLESFSDAEDKLLSSFQTAYGKKPESIVILDEDPEKEGLFFEFLILQEWFENHGIKATIQSLEAYNEKPASDFVYNRYTDFYLDKDISKKLREGYLSQSAIVSPNPREYFLMADKKRLPSLRQYDGVKSFIPESKTFSEFESADELWSLRKKYFFKPSQSFGSKAVYQGKSISKTNFQKIFSPDYMAQELVPPGRLQRTHQGEEVEMKYDLRFYSFAGEIQNAGARLYRGQTTNMKTPLGGLAPLRFT